MALKLEFPYQFLGWPLRPQLIEPTVQWFIRPVMPFESDGTGDESGKEGINKERQITHQRK